MEGIEKPFKKLRFGTAGIPIYAKGLPITEGVLKVDELGLEAMELEFVRRINISAETAPAVKNASKSSDVALTCHGQYYINLNAREEEKEAASIQRVLNAARRADDSGAFSMTFHAAYYLGMEKEPVYARVRNTLKSIVKVLKDEGRKIWVRPETTGKPVQFGDIHEIIRLSEEVEQVLPCIDFAHLYARSAGKINSYEQFSEILSSVEERLGREALQRMHIHMSGIAYSDKGERYHLPLEESDFNYRAVLKALKDFKARGVVISESPIIEKDALLMKEVYSSL